MSTPKRIDINGTGQFLDAVQVDQGLGPALRETVVIADPTTPSAMAPVSATDGLSVKVTNLPASTATSTPATTAEGLVTRVAGYVAPFPMTQTADGRLRTSEITTLFDGKILNQEDTFKWDTKGTGTATFSENAIVMSVTAGQYVVRQSKHWNAYFSGNAQMIEPTFINFENEADVVKRVGYYSSSAAAPYSADLDGIWIEADGTTYRPMSTNQAVAGAITVTEY